MDASTSQAIARAVAEHLLNLSHETLQRYLAETYGIEHSGLLSIAKVYVGEVKSADFRQPAISSDPVRCWRVEPTQTVLIPYLDMRPFNEACDLGSQLWPYPVISFYADLPEGLTCEGVGPATKCYRRVRLDQTPTGFRIAKSEIARLLKG